MAYFFKDLDLNMMFWIVSAILAAAGMLFQFKPWKEADYWEDDDEEEREHRAKARARRKRRSGFDPLPSRKKKKKRRGSSSSSSGNARDPYRSYQKPSNRTRVSQNTMYDFRFVPEEPDDDDDEEDLPKIIRRRPSAKPAAPEEFDEEETSPKASMGDTKPYTSPSKPQITEDGIPDVDLSAIRQQISEEVQRIYEDDQNS